MRLQDDLRAAVDDTPLPRFDLDRVIRRARARRTRSRLLAGVAGAVAITAVSAGGYVTAAGWLAGAPDGRVGAPPPATLDPWATQPAATAETRTPEQETAERLTAALRSLPPSLQVPTDGSARSNHVTSGWRPHYSAAWRVGHLRYTIMILADKPDYSCAPGEDPNGCLPNRDENGIMHVHRCHCGELDRGERHRQASTDSQRATGRRPHRSQDSRLDAVSVGRRAATDEGPGVRTGSVRPVPRGIAAFGRRRSRCSVPTAA
jgi:hypothetical protein